MRIISSRNQYEKQVHEYEKDYQGFVKKLAPKLFPDYHILEIELKTESNKPDSSPKKCDFLFIKKDYSAWWVVEVEMYHHSIDSHVRPQVEVLASGDYNESHANFILEKYSNLDSRKLAELVTESIPRILVLVNDDAPNLIEQWDGIGQLDNVDIGYLICFRELTTSEEIAVYAGPDINRFNPQQIFGLYDWISCSGCFVFEKPLALIRGEDFGDGGRVESVLFDGHEIACRMMFSEKAKSLKLHVRDKSVAYSLFKPKSHYWLSRVTSGQFSLCKI